MKEQIHTIPISEAMENAVECPLCYIERRTEDRVMDFVLGHGASYMEADIRSMTDEQGFCRNHFKKMFDYGNSLGNAWILKTHYMQINREMKEQFKNFKPGKTSLKDKFKKQTEARNPIGMWVTEKENSCYICKRYADTYERYLDTFFVMYKKDPEFRDKVKNSKGFCLHHFGDLCEAADNRLNDKEKEEFYSMVFSLMEENMARLSEDVSWLVEKFDYRKG